MHYSSYCNVSRTLRALIFYSSAQLLTLFKSLIRNIEHAITLLGFCKADQRAHLYDIGFDVAESKDSAFTEYIIVVGHDEGGERHFFDKEGIEAPGDHADAMLSEVCCFRRYNEGQSKFDEALAMNDNLKTYKAFPNISVSNAVRDFITDYQPIRKEFVQYDLLAGRPLGFHTVTKFTKKGYAKEHNLFRGAHDGCNDAVFTLLGLIYIILAVATEDYGYEISSEHEPYAFPVNFRLISVDCEGPWVPKFQTRNPRTRQFGFAELRSVDIQHVPINRWVEKMRGVSFHFYPASAANSP